MQEQIISKKETDHDHNHLVPVSYMIEGDLLRKLKASQPNPSNLVIKTGEDEDGVLYDQSFSEPNRHLKRGTPKWDD